MDLQEASDLIVGNDKLLLAAIEAHLRQLIGNECRIALVVNCVIGVSGTGVSSGTTIFNCLPHKAAEIMDMSADMLRTEYSDEIEDER